MSGMRVSMKKCHLHVFCSELLPSQNAAEFYVVKYQPEDAGIIGEVLRQHFSVGQLPAMSLIGAQALAKEEFLVEVNAEAIVDSDR